jgi:hypothetical protein
VEEHEHLEMSSPNDAADLHEDEDPGQYLYRLFDGLQTLQAKVHLKLAKLQRRKAWIFEDGEPATENIQKRVRNAMAALVETQMELQYEGIIEPAAIAKRTAEHLVRQFGRDYAEAIVSSAEHLVDEIGEQWELTEQATSSPHYPYLRQVLDLPAYETRQVYFE